MKYFILVSLFFLSLTIKAQESNLEIIKSKVFVDEKYNTSLLFAKEDSNGDIFLVRNYYKSEASPLGYYIEHYNKELYLLKRDKIEINRSELRGVYLNDSEIVLLQFKYLQKEKVYEFTTLTSNKTEFNFIEKGIFTIDRDKIKRYDHFGIRKEPEYTIHEKYKFGDVVESDNNGFIAINLFIKDKNKIDSFLVVVFNDKFEKIYEHVLDEVQMVSKFEKPMFDYQNIKLDNQGNIYLLGKIYQSNSKKEKVKGSPNYKYELFKINSQGQKQITLGDSKYFIDDLQIVLKDNILSCIGFYHEKESNNTYSKEGIVRINIDVINENVLLKSYQPFQESINTVTFQKMISFTAIINNLTIDKSFVDDNGDIVFYSEEFSIFISDNNIQSKNSYGNIVAIKINNEGELLWINNINKYQKAWSTDKTPFLSFSATSKNKLSYLYFNADSEVKKDKNDKLKFRYSKSKNILNSATIKENGEISFDKLTFEKLNDILLELRFGVQLKNETLLFEAKTNDKPLLVKLTQ